MTLLCFLCLLSYIFLHWCMLIWTHFQIMKSAYVQASQNLTIQTFLKSQFYFFLYCWLPVADAMHDKVISGTHLLNIRYIVNLHHKSGLTLLWFLSYFNPCFCHTLYLTFIQKYQQKNIDKLVNAVCCYFRKFCWSRILSPTWWKR